MLKKSIVMVIFLTTCLAGWSVEVGDTRAEVEQELGKPLGQMGQGGQVVLMYDGGAITLQKDRVVEIEGNWDRREKKRQTERAFVKSQQEKGLVPYEGQWMKPLKRDRLMQQAKARARVEASMAAAGSNRGGGRGGPVDMNQVLVSGKVTVVDFYADWCGPCRVISPKLQQLASQNGDVELRKIDIVNWGSPVAKQFGLRSIPNIRVYDRHGKLVGQPTSRIAEVKKNVQQAM